MKSIYLIHILLFSTLIAFGQKTRPDSTSKDEEDINLSEKILSPEQLKADSIKAAKSPVSRRVGKYDRYRGKIIRAIHYRTFDPFGYTLEDTLKKPKSYFERAGNTLHQKSGEYAIRNQLIFQEGDRLDPLRIKESERILRAAVHVKDIIIDVEPVSIDSVDVIIREQDLWSKGVHVSIHSNKYTLGVNDRNFLGLSHYLYHDFSYNNDSSRVSVSGGYSVPYVRHTLIVPSVYYDSDPDNFFRGGSLKRSFITPFIKWAGSMEFYDTKLSTFETTPEGDTTRYATRFFIQDFWGARSFSLKEDTSRESQSTKVIFGARYRVLNFNYSPPDYTAPTGTFENSRLLLFNLGLTRRNYFRDKYIYRFGIQEDVPVGSIINFITGYEWKETLFRTYFGMEAGTGNYFRNLGYFSATISGGTFLRSGNYSQGVVNLSFGYFSELLQIRRTRYRQFFKLNYTHGFYRFPGERLTFEDEIYDFDSEGVPGIKKLSFNLQTQAYLPYSVLGFYFAPYFFASAGLISGQGAPLTDSKLYQGYGVGLIIKNELFIISSIQLSIGFYPFQPGEGRNLLKANPVRTYEFKFNDFEIDKPSLIPF